MNNWFFGGERLLDKNKFDKGDLKKELKRSGFDNCITDDIVDRVNDRKNDQWDASKGREQAMVELKSFLDNNNRAYDVFRKNASTVNDTIKMNR